MNRKWYVAYGSNMNIDQMRYRCKDAELIGIGVLEGYELEFRHYASIKEVPCTTIPAPVVIWSISEEDEKNLDVYEGVAHSLYFKKSVSVKLTVPITQPGSSEGAKESLEALVYIMTPDKYASKAPTEGYYQSIVEGYQANGIGLEPLLIAMLQAPGDLTP